MTEELEGWTENMDKTFCTWQDGRLVRPVDNECSWSWDSSNDMAHSLGERSSMWLLILPNGEVRGRFVEGPTILDYDVASHTAYRSFQLDYDTVWTLVERDYLSIQTFLPSCFDDEDFHIPVPKAVNAWAQSWIAANPDVTPLPPSLPFSGESMLSLCRNIAPRGL